MSHTPTRSWEDFERDYRMEWERNYPNIPWNDVSYGYRYGWEQAGVARFHGRDWFDVEDELRTSWSEWESSNRSTSMGRQLQQSWEELKENVRYGWERAKNELDERI
jgi:hypothetical protein